VLLFDGEVIQLSEKDTSRDLQKQLADLKIRLEKAERDSRTKSEFLMGMGHQLRTPMNGIMGMTNLVLETDLTDEQRSRLEMVNASADQLLEVVADILDFCRIESCSMRFNNEDFTLSESIDCDLYLMILAARQKNINLSYQIDPDVPQYLNSDPDRLVQVIMNLVNNAIKFTAKGEVSLRIENLGDAEQQVVLKFSVTDTGIGIPPEKQRMISDTFNRRYTSYSTEYWSGGLGLTISAHLVHLAGGDIGLESSPGKGATFWFTWKFNKAKEYTEPESYSEPLPESSPEFTLEGVRVLLAEDEVISRVLIKTLLEEAGIEVTVAENGRQAADEAIEGSYQAVLMDIQMPVLDGLEATREIRERERDLGRHLPIIALTAHVMPGDREKCLQAGMDDYLPKPVSKAGLFEILSHYLTSSALVAEEVAENQQKIVEFLIEKGWQVTIAEPGRAVLYEATLRHFDLILLSLGEEGEGGLETVQSIRRLEEYTGRRSLVLGIQESSPTEQEMSDYRVAGLDDVFTRPFVPDAFITRLKP
jgi:CheY-like chemotaxis protein/nitrogen-specific signal transduction histidine kinase